MHNTTYLFEHNEKAKTKRILQWKRFILNTEIQFDIYCKLHDKTIFPTIKLKNYIKIKTLFKKDQLKHKINISFIKTSKK
jgi:hypothetical protein